MLTISDGGGVQEPLILTDVICEQPLIALLKSYIVALLHCSKVLQQNCILGDHFRKISEIFLPGS